jgi:hypothetical protein
MNDKGLKVTVTTLAFCFLLGHSFAQIRKYSNEFMNIGVGARGLGMANATVATTSDVHSGFYNPAGLVHIKESFQVGLMHSEYFAGIAKYDYGAVAVPIRQKNMAVGFSFFRFGIDDIPNTLFLVGPDGSLNYNNITSFSAADYGFLFHFAQKFEKIKGLSVGGSAKIIYRKIGKFASATGFGIDLGLQYRYRGARIGLMLKDISTTFNAWRFTFTEDEKLALLSTNNDLPRNSIEQTAPMLTLGAGYKINIKDKVTVTPEVNLIFNTDGRRNVLLPIDPVSLDLSAGMEIGLWKIGFLRAGVGNIQRYYAEDGKRKYSVSPSVGAGVKIKLVALDYSLTNLTSLSGSRDNGLYSHVISLRLDINVRQKGSGRTYYQNDDDEDQ